MNDRSNFFDALEVMRLSDAGRHGEALRCGAIVPPDLAALTAFRARVGTVAAPEGTYANAHRGWEHYYAARYASACQSFVAALGETSSWVASWAALGLAKVATDTGRFATAARWCSVAARHARASEHLDLLAEVTGARGEVYLRAGHPLEAAEAFTLDQALLPPGSRFHGRLMCYRAHAYSRLGRAAWPAAELQYRLAIHTPGEDTSTYALAGLALLGAEWARDEPARRALTIEAYDRRPRGPSALGFWMAVARARLALLEGEAPLDFMVEAASLLPSEYHFERLWLEALAGTVGVTLPRSVPFDSDELSPVLPDPLLQPSWGRTTPMERFPLDDALSDAGMGELDRCGEAEEIWSKRRVFMP